MSRSRCLLACGEVTGKFFEAALTIVLAINLAVERAVEHRPGADHEHDATQLHPHRSCNSPEGGV